MGKTYSFPDYMNRLEGSFMPPQHVNARCGIPAPDRPSPLYTLFERVVAAQGFCRNHDFNLKDSIRVDLTASSEGNACIKLRGVYALRSDNRGVFLFAGSGNLFYVAVCSLDWQRAWVASAPAPCSIIARFRYKNNNNDQAAADFEFRSPPTYGVDRSVHWFDFNPERLDPTGIDNDALERINRELGLCPLCRLATVRSGESARCGNCSAAFGPHFSAACRLNRGPANRVANLIRGARCHVCKEPYEYDGGHLVCESCSVTFKTPGTKNVSYRVGDAPFLIPSDAPPVHNPGDVVPLFDKVGKLGDCRVLVREPDAALPLTLPGNVYPVTLLRRRDLYHVPYSVHLYARTDYGREFDIPSVVHALPGKDNRLYITETMAEVEAAGARVNGGGSLPGFAVDFPVVSRDAVLAALEVFRVPDVAAAAERALPYLIYIEKTIRSGGFNLAKPGDRSPPDDRMPAGQLAVLLGEVIK